MVFVKDAALKSIHNKKRVTLLFQQFSTLICFPAISHTNVAIDSAHSRLKAKDKIGYYFVEIDYWAHNQRI